MTPKEEKLFARALANEGVDVQVDRAIEKLQKAVSVLRRYHLCNVSIDEMENALVDADIALSQMRYGLGITGFRRRRKIALALMEASSS